jgi:hypothetical protein
MSSCTTSRRSRIESLGPRPVTVQLRMFRLPSVPTVTAQDAIYQSAGQGNAITGASAVAVAIRAVTGAAVVERSTAVTVAAAVTSTVAAAVSDTTTATNVAGRDVTGTCTTRHCMSAATMTSRMAGCQCVRHHGNATERNRSSESDECFMKHLILLIMAQGQRICREDTDNVALPRMVARG